MSIQIATRQNGDVTIVDITGRITLGEGSDSLRDKIDELVQQGKKRIILNLAETSYADSTGIAQLVQGFTTLANRDGWLKLLAPGKKVKYLLQVTNLYTVFEVYYDEATAVRSFR